MASYDYECKECSNVQEVQHGMNESPEIVCEKCGGETKRVIVLPNVKFTDSFRFGREKDNKEIAELKEKIQQDPQSDPYKKYREDPERDLKIK